MQCKKCEVELKEENQCCEDRHCCKACCDCSKENVSCGSECDCGHVVE